MRNYLFIALAIFTVVGCHPHKQDKTIISGQVLSGEKEVFLKHISSSTLDTNIQNYEAIVDKDGKFSIELAINNLTTGVINIGNYYHRFSISPYDKLAVIINGDSIEYSGVGANKNKLSKEIDKNDLSVNAVYTALYREKHSLESFSKMLNKFKFQRDSVLNSFAIKYTIDSSFISSYNIETQIMYNYGLYRYPWIYLNQEGKIMDDIELSDAYNQYRTINDLVNDTYVNNNFYMDIISQAIHNAAYTRSMENRSITIADIKLELILDIPGLTRQYLLAKYISNNATLKATIDPTLIQSFNMLSPNKEVSLYVDCTIRKFDKKQSYIGSTLPSDILATELEDTAGNKLTFGDLINNNKGKVLYIDMWSLGCNPCRIAMPYSKQLNSELENNKISFIYITQDRMKDDIWSEIFKVSMTTKNHYRFINGNNTPLHKLFEIYWVPNYMVFDRSGTLVSYSALAPIDFESESMNVDLKDFLLDL